MPLQLRRGNTAEVNSITPLVGEIVYDSQLKRVVVGDGTTAGGVAVAGVSIPEAKDAAAASLLAGTHQNIAFSYNSVTKALSATVDILTHDTIEADAIITGRIFNTSSSVVINVDTGTFTGNLTGAVNGNVTGNLTGNVTGNINGVVTGTAGSSLIGNVTGNVTGNTTGYHSGDVKGSVFADDSSIMVDAVSRVFLGNLTGNVTGNVTGNITTTQITSTDSSTIQVNHSLRTLSSLIVDHDLDVSGTSIFRDEIRNIVTNEASRFMRLEQYHTSQFASALAFFRARGTPGSPSAIQTEDAIGDIDFNAFTTTGLTVSAASIKGLGEGTITGTAVPGRLDFFTADASGTMTRRMYLDSLGLIYLDGSTRITINGYAAGPVFLAQQFHSTADARNVTFRRGRGTDTAPTAVVNGDEISEITFVAHDGSAYVTSSEITHTVDGAVSTGVIPSRIDISTTNEVGTRANRLSIKGRTIDMLAMPVLPTFADETAANAAVTTPANGMMYYDSGAGKIKGYQGGAWVVLQP